jgi:hypothetical protein
MRSGVWMGIVPREAVRVLLTRENGCQSSESFKLGKITVSVGRVPRLHVLKGFAFVECAGLCEKV